MSRKLGGAKPSHTSHSFTAAIPTSCPYSVSSIGETFHGDSIPPVCLRYVLSHAGSLIFSCTHSQEAERDESWSQLAFFFFIFIQSGPQLMGQ